MAVSFFWVNKYLEIGTMFRFVSKAVFSPIGAEKANFIGQDRGKIRKTGLVSGFL